MGELILYSLIGGLFSLIGGLLLLWKPSITKKIITPLIAFGAGAFLGAAFLDILPEAIESVEEPHPIFIAALVGFMAFFLLERFLMKYTKGTDILHEHSEHTEPLPFLLILGDSIHNFMDGIVIAFAFAANPALGLPTALAIAAHEVPQEIGDFSILLHLGWKKTKVLTVNILQSLAIIPGVFIGQFLGQAIESQLPLLLGATAGIFIYIAGSDIIPELHHQAGHKHIYRVVVPMIVGIIAIFYLVGLAHG